LNNFDKILCSNGVARNFIRSAAAVRTPFFVRALFFPQGEDLSEIPPNFLCQNLFGIFRSVSRDCSHQVRGRPLYI